MPIIRAQIRNRIDARPEIQTSQVTSRNCGSDGRQGCQITHRRGELSLSQTREGISLVYHSCTYINFPRATFSTVPKKPVIALPGLTPRLPVRVVPPVLVTVEAPRTAKLSKSLPRSAPAEALGAVAICKTADAAAQRRNVLTLFISRVYLRRRTGTMSAAWAVPR